MGSAIQASTLRQIRNKTPVIGSPPSTRIPAPPSTTRRRRVCRNLVPGSRSASELAIATVLYIRISQNMFHKLYENLIMYTHHLRDF